MPEAISPIPEKRPEDPEEVAHELTLAANSWRGGDQAEALAALRRAASVAYRLHAGRRVSELAKAVSELSKTMMGGGSVANQKAGAAVPSAAARASAPSAAMPAAMPPPLPKVSNAPSPPSPAIPLSPPSPVIAAAPMNALVDEKDVSSEDIPISFEEELEVSIFEDPFPSRPALVANPTVVASPGGKKNPALSASSLAKDAKEARESKEPPEPMSPGPGSGKSAAATPVAAPERSPEKPPERSSRTSNRPGKGRRSTPPKSKDGERTEKSGAIVASATTASASTETSGVIDVEASENAKTGNDAASAPNDSAASETGALPTTGAEPTAQPSVEATASKDAATAHPALQHNPTPVGEESETPGQSSAKKSQVKFVGTKTQLPVDPPTIADLDSVSSLSSLDAVVKAKIIASAKAIALVKGDKLDAPAAIIVVRGEVDVRPKERAIAVDRILAGEARTLVGAPPAGAFDLVLLCGDQAARCLLLPAGALEVLRQSAPEVHEALERRADELCAFASVLRERPIGGLADGLLLELRRRGEVRRLPEGTVIVRAGEAVRALVVVASGALTLHVDETAPESGRIRAGEVLFPRELVSKTSAPREARVAAGGVLLLAARRGPTVTLLGENTHLRKALETWGTDDPFQEW